ncbi:MAG: 50S ribosomal protein L19 [Acidobacteriota bacterium]
MDVIRTCGQKDLKDGIPSFSSGDTVKVSVKVKEGDKERTQVFQGVVTGIRGGGLQRTFTVRKVSARIGVERIFPIHSPMIGKIEVVQRAKTRRSKLYYLRERVGKAARLRAVRDAIEDREKD